MKTLFTLFIFNLSFIIFNCTAQWVELDTGLENPPVFNDVYAITPEIVVVVGANGTILKTTDGGETWEQKPSGTTENLRKVQFPTSNIGYVIGDNGKLLKTTDGGETWAAIDTGQNANFEGLSVVNENLICILYYDNLFKTEDGGNTWINIPINSINKNYIQFFNNSFGYISLQSGSLYKTEDSGHAWQELFGVAPYYFINENIGFYYEDGLLKTIDAGNNFEYIGFGTGEYLSTILAINENTVWGVFEGLLDGDGTTRGLIKITYSNTEPYLEEIWYDNNSQMNMSSIHFADENTGYIVGFNQGKGAIWKNGTGINTMSMEEQSIEKLKVYPNPVSGKLNIDFDKPAKADISLTDMTGKKVYTQSFTESKISIDVRNIPKGIYILKVNNHSQKIIIN